MIISILLFSSVLLSSCASREKADGTRTSRETKTRTTSVTTALRSHTSSTPSSTDPQDPSSVPTDLTKMESIADIDWARNQGMLFDVTTKEEFAGTVFYLNYFKDNQFAQINIKEDLDLSGIEWIPLDHFHGNIDGGGHTIRNITLVSQNNHNGIIGANGGPIGVSDLNVIDARVYGGNYAGIVVGEGYMLDFVDVFASGEIYSDGQYVGALIGRTSPSMKYDTCSMDVTINGKPAEYLSYTQENEARAFQFEDEIYTLTLKDDYTVVRNDVNYQAHNLGWRIIYNGNIVLERNAENELEYKYFGTSPGTYEIYLTEYNSEFGGYVRISNIVEYTI